MDFFGIGDLSLKTLTFYSSMALYGLSLVYILMIVITHRRQPAKRGTKNVLSSSLDNLMELSESADRYEGADGHGQRIAELVCQMAERYGLSSRDMESLRMAALLHDIGQIDQCPYIKEQRMLSHEERFDLEKHPSIGYKLILAMGTEFGNVAKWVRWHHERWDGTGYPDRLSGERIPLPVRILTVADAYDAMSHARPYRSALSPERILNELQRHSGTLFDPQVVQLFINTLGTERAMSATRLEIE